MEAPAHPVRVLNYLGASFLKHSLEVVLTNELNRTFIHTLHAEIKGFVNITIGIGKLHTHFYVKDHQVSL